MSMIGRWLLPQKHRTPSDANKGRTLLSLGAERVLGHSLGGLMATYNVSQHRKQKMAALVALEVEILRIVNDRTSGGDNVVPLRLAS
jgi:hypothetical protein